MREDAERHANNRVHAELATRGLVGRRVKRGPQHAEKRSDGSGDGAGP